MGVLKYDPEKEETKLITRKNEIPNKEKDERTICHSWLPVYLDLIMEITMKILFKLDRPKLYI